jgi:bifunctional non-homologous end joining protein LigD
MAETIDGRSLDITNRGKLFFPDCGVTKGDIIDYYGRIYPQMEAHLAGRPVSFERYPDGIEGTHFFQKNAPEYFPDWIRTVTLAKQDGEVDYVIIDERPALVFLADQAAVLIHIFLSTAERPHTPNRFIFDLDPPGDEFTPVRDAAWILQDVLEDVGLHPHVMTTGSKGLHVTTPLVPEHGFDAVRAFAREIAQRAVNEHPKLVTLEQRLENRKGKVYLDIIRNAYGQTGVCPYSLRATPDASIAAPLAWDELGSSELRPDGYTLGNIFRRLGQKDDPWKSFQAAAEPLGPARERLNS